MTTKFKCFLENMGIKQGMEAWLLCYNIKKQG